MGKDERRIFLDRLVRLRADHQSTTPVATSMTIEGAIHYATALFDDSDRLDAILGGDAADATPTSDTPA